MRCDHVVIASELRTLGSKVSDTLEYGDLCIAISWRSTYSPVPLVCKIGTQVNRRSAGGLMKSVHGWW